MAPCFGTICRIIKRNKYTKVISIVDNIIPHEKRPSDRLLAKFWIKCVDGFVCMSKSVIDDLKTFFTPTVTPKPTLYCAHPLYDNFGDPVSKEVAKQRLALDERFHYLLFFGFIRDYKGLDLLLKAFADEKLRKYPLKLVIAGEFYCDPKPYHNLVDNLGIKDNVVMSNDFIPDSEVVNYFCAADIVVQPYKSATQSGVTQIAYHFNKPMIITNVGGLSEFVPDGKVGYVTDPDEKQIAIAILKFFQEKKEKEFSTNASIEKLKYSWGKMLETIDLLSGV
jgi:D-inositol-3-phosphate glycosyltransferase